ncbi:MAG: response regulator [Anaerolineae bacterium]|nr:response regulator [Anaerolineae bacterium]
MTKSIMIVDDSPEILALYSTMFEFRGYRVFKARDGASALQILEDSVPDLFILDIMMPEINGIELCQRIRDLPQHEHTPILFLSAYTDTEIVGKTFAAGANDFVTKPIDAQILEAKVRELLESTET